MKLPFITKQVLVIAAICITTFITFQYTQQNQFTNWDDDFYVTNNPYIKAFTKENLKVIFTEDITKNNYHPLCMLSLAVNYHFSGLDPQPYYLTNILIHIANTILVFFLMILLCRRLKVGEAATLFIAGFGGLWFGIHPMRVESVAWIAERKDVLYAFFYFAGMLTYLQYMKEDGKKWLWYLATYLLFVMSCLSKPMAVVFPISLLCLDVLMYRGKKVMPVKQENITKSRNNSTHILPEIKNYSFDTKQLLNIVFTEKVIFFLTSLACGMMAFYTQNKTGAVADFGMLTIAERIMYAGYGYIMYISKLFNPTYLSTFYPYPIRFVNGSLPQIFYLAPVLAIASVAGPLWYTWKYKREYFRITAFGILYFVANVMFVLQFVSVGAAIMADRYSYVAYFGLFFILFYFLYELVKKYPGFKLPLLVVLFLSSAGLAYACYERTFAWHDSESLLTDAIEKYPVKKDPDGNYDRKNTGIAQLSYKWRGNYYMDKGMVDKALEDYETLTMLHMADAKVYDRVATIYAAKKDYKKAMEMFDQSLQVQNNVYKTYVDRALVLLEVGDTVNALKDYVIAYQLNGAKAEAVLNDSGFQSVQRGAHDLAYARYNLLLKLNTNNPFYYFYRGVALYSKGYVDPAIADWETAMKFNVADTRKAASNNLCVAYDAIGEHALALKYLEISLATGNKPTQEFIESVRKKATGK